MAAHAPTPTHVRRTGGAVAAVVLAVTGLLGPAAAAAPTTAPTTTRVAAPAAATGWVGAWAASPQPPTPSSLASPTDFSARGFTDQTVRQVVRTSAGGTSLLLRFSNAYGTRPVQLGRVSIGLDAGGAAVVAGTAKAVTFGGRRTTTIPVGAELYSDPVALAAGAGTDLSVTAYLPGPTGPATYHSLAQATSFVGGGDRSGQPGAAGFTTTTSNYYFLDGVDVRGGATSTVVAVGDSITDGYGSTPDADNRWPDLLGQRLQAQPGNTLAVVDVGISGNRVLNDSPCFGRNLLSRLDRDVLTQDGASTVILLEGINDIGFSQSPNAGCSSPNTAVSAAQIIEGYRQVVTRAHLHGLTVLGATLTPFKGAAYWSQAAEDKRTEVNRFIRNGGLFDGVVEFATAIADPAHPQRMAAAYDSGDHLHPNDAGYARMAAAVDLGLLS